MIDPLPRKGPEMSLTATTRPLNIELAFACAASDLQIRRIVEQALEETPHFTPHPADPSVSATDSPAGLLHFKRPMMAMTWRVPAEFLTPDSNPARAEQLVAALYAASTGKTPGIRRLWDKVDHPRGWSFHQDAPSARMHLTLSGAPLYWVSGIKDNYPLKLQALVGEPPAASLQQFSLGELARFNGGCADDLVHSAGNLRPGDRRHFILANPLDY